MTNVFDFASLKSVRACADKLVAKGEPFDVFIANTGVMTVLRELSRRPCRSGRPDHQRHQ
jgi:hypothetical protein